MGLSEPQSSADTLTVKDLTDMRSGTYNTSMVGRAYQQLSDRAPSMNTEIDYFSSNRKFNALNIFLHPSRTIRELYKSASPQSWMECRRSIKLFPLCFRDERLEQNYANRRAAVPNELHYGILIIFTALVLLASLTGIFEETNIDGEDKKDLAISSVLPLCGSLAILLIAWMVNRKGEAKHGFIWAQVSLVLVVCLIEFWLFLVIIIVTSNPSMGEHSRARFIMWVTSTSQVIEMIFLVQVNVLGVRARTSLWLHLGIVAYVVLFRIMVIVHYQYYGLSSLYYVLCLGLIYTISWMGQWLLELQSRCCLMSMEQALNIFTRAKRLEEIDGSVSPAEQAIAILKNCQAAVEDRGRSSESKLITKLLAEARMNLTVRRLTNPDDSRNSFRTIYRIRDNVRKNTAVRFDKSLTIRRPGESDVTESLSGDAESDDTDLEKRVEEACVPADTVFWSALNQKHNHKLFSEICLNHLSEQEEYLRVTKGTLVKFLNTVKSTIWTKNPYHSTLHCVQTLNSLVALLAMLRLKTYMSRPEYVACLLAGISTNMGHTGRSSRFYVDSNAILAMATNNDAVTQHFQYALLQDSLKQSKLLDNVSIDDQVLIKKMTRAMILSTDPDKHFAMLSQFRFAKNQNNFDYVLYQNDRLLLAQLCINAAVLAPAFLPWKDHYQWAIRYLHEQQMQRADELLIFGSTFTPDSSSFAKYQLTFLTTIVMPLVLLLNEIGDVSEIIMNVQNNEIQWQACGNLKSAIDLSEDWELAPRLFPLICLTNSPRG